MLKLLFERDYSILKILKKNKEAMNFSYAKYLKFTNINKNYLSFINSIEDDFQD